MFDSLPESVRVYEVGPRDGLQNEKAFIATEDKLRLIGALAEAGLRHIEATSFVNPRWIPPLADADHVAAGLPGLPVPEGAPVTYTALVPNMRGLTRAIDAGLKEVAVFMSSSETHNKRNINKAIDETWPVFEPVFAACAEAGVQVRAYVSTAWGCPYEGDVDPQQVLRITERLLAMGAYEVSLGDTIGVGHPMLTRRLLDVVLAKVDAQRVAMHMHDTRGTALANCLVGLEMGITTFDASIGGLGGCPYAPGASGNLATEDLVYMLHEMGVETGVDFDKLIDAGMLAEQLLGRGLPGRALKAFAAARRADA
ncbi:MAG: hydroxymethylglutaryl-CoA lyase [Bradymonadia bacterium]